MQEYELNGRCIREIQHCYRILIQMFHFSGDSNSVEIITREVLLFDIENGWRLLQVVRNKIQLKFENRFQLLTQLRIRTCILITFMALAITIHFIQNN